MYGVSNFLRDANFMLDRKLGNYWKFCWGFIVPATLGLLFIYFLSTFSMPKYDNVAYPNVAILCGGILVSIALIQVPIGMIYAYHKSDKPNFSDRFTEICTPRGAWGPLDERTKGAWLIDSKTSSRQCNEEYSLIGNEATIDD